MEKSCSLLMHFNVTPALASKIKESLEGNDVALKIEALKKALTLLINGETIPELWITVIRYTLTCDNHTLQKFILLYLEIINRTDSRGRVLPEMILIGEFLRRRNLQSPNEFIRGATLRFLSRINEHEIVEPLIPSILLNLEHRHPFVRRNAILAVMSVYKLPQGEQLLINGPEIVEKFLEAEHDPSCKRNAFLMLFSCAQDRAIKYLFSNIDNIIDWDEDEQLQMIVLEVIKKVYKWNEKCENKWKYMKIIISLLSANSTAVVYECAGTLVLVSSTPNAIKVAATTYCQLLLSSKSDNNVKLIVLDRLNELNREIMVNIVMDVLRALSTTRSYDVRRKIIDVALELITPENIDEVVMMLEKEVVKTKSGEHEKKKKKKNGKYRKMLVEAIHTVSQTKSLHFVKVK